MKKYTFVMLTMISAAISHSAVIAEENFEQLNPTIQNELVASIKADRLLAERQLMMDIEKDITDQQSFPKLSNEYSDPMQAATDNMLASFAALFDANKTE